MCMLFLCEKKMMGGHGYGYGYGDGDGTPLSVLVVGGSLAGLSCAHALLRAGCHVLVLEKSRCLSPAGAGLGLDALASSVLQQWGLGPDLLRCTLPLSSEVNRAIDNQEKIVRVLAADDDFNHRAAYWSDLHRILYDALPAGTVLWGHEVLSFKETMNGSRAKVELKAMPVGTCDTLEFEGDLLVAADGSLSRTRKHLLPHEKRRYCGYCAWRGVLDSSSKRSLEISAALHRHYAKLGHCLYFDIANGSHAVLYELEGGRLNWIWYVNQPEPHLKDGSVTAKAGDEEIAKMQAEAVRVWMPELAALMNVTPAPFINAIFDREPLQQLVWGRIVLVGEAAHPTSPHGLRSTNMSILDAAALGKAITKWSSNLDEALKEYESLRLPVTSQQVLFSRFLGKLKQGILADPPGSFPWPDAKEEDCQKLLQRNMPTFQHEI